MLDRMCDSSRSGRLVVSLQIVSWCAVGVVLLLRGATTLRNESSIATIRNCSSESNETSYGINDNDFGNSSSTEEKPRKTTAVRINASSAILITVGITMLVIGPTLLLARLIDHRRQHQAPTGFMKVDAPPSYEEVTEKAPRYSALFQVTDTGEWVPIPPCQPLQSEPA